MPTASSAEVRAKQHSPVRLDEDAKHQGTGSTTPFEHDAPGQDGDDDAVPLLGLEPHPTSAIEKAGQNPTSPEDSHPQSRRTPLLGTSYSQSVENAGGSSKRRSPESVCYDKLLRENGSSSGRKSRKTVIVEGRVCYFVAGNFGEASALRFMASATARCRPFLPKTHSGSCAGAYSLSTGAQI